MGATGFASTGYEKWKSTRPKTGFPRKPDDDVLRIYTTRPDTLFGATYMVIAPEHPFVERLTTPEQRCQREDVLRGRPRARATSIAPSWPRKRRASSPAATPINPVNGEPMPIWIADYVLISYGTGAIMAVPAHDERDFEFAQQFGLPIRAVVDPGERYPPTSARTSSPASGASPAKASRSTRANYDGLPTAEFKAKITADLAEQGLGRQAVNYKLRDWLFSRQRFWGEPFPILHELDAERQADRPRARGRRKGPAGRPAASGRLQAARPPGAAARQGAGRVALPGDRRRALQARDEHDAAVGRLAAGTTCGFSIRRTTERADRSGDRKGLDAGRSVRRRRGACRAAPAVRAVLAQGALRPRRRQHARAVSEARQPGHDPGREQREDVQEPRQRHQPGHDRGRVRGRLAAAVRNVHGPARSGQALEHAGRQRRVRLLEPCVAADRRRAGGSDAAQRSGGRSPADGRGQPRAAPDDSGGDRGHSPSCRSTRPSRG